MGTQLWIDRINKQPVHTTCEKYVQFMAKKLFGNRRFTAIRVGPALGCVLISTAGGIENDLAVAILPFVRLAHASLQIPRERKVTDGDIPRLSLGGPTRATVGQSKVASIRDKPSVSSSEIFLISRYIIEGSS